MLVRNGVQHAAGQSSIMTKPNVQHRLVVRLATLLGRWKNVQSFEILLTPSYSAGWA